MAKEKNLSSLFQEISIKWISYVEHCKSKIKKNTYNIDSSHEFHDLFIIQFKQKIESLVDKKKFIVKSSVGEGNLAGIPWLCVMDLSITGKSTEGFYIVYLFSQDAKKVFLSIGIGAGQFIDIYGDNKLAINKI